MPVIQGQNVITGAIKRGQVVRRPGVEYYVDAVNGSSAADGVAAVGVRFVGTSAVGVRSDGEGAYFENCDFTSDTSHGFHFLGATATANTGSGTVFDGCVFRECGGAGLRSSKGTGGWLGLEGTGA